MAWTVEKRKTKLTRGAVQRVATQLGEDKRLVSKVLRMQAGLYGAERVRRIEEALALEAGVTWRTMFGVR